MTHAIRFHKPGGPEVLQWDEVQVGKPGQIGRASCMERVYLSVVAV